MVFISLYRRRPFFTIVRFYWFCSVYHSSAYKTSEAVTLVESTQPQIDIEYSGGAINVKSDVPVSGELYINAGTDDGEWFEFTEKSDAS